MPVLIANCGLCLFMCASRQMVPNHVFCRGLTTLLVLNHVHVPRREDMALVTDFGGSASECVALQVIEYQP